MKKIVRFTTYIKNILNTKASDLFTLQICVFEAMCQAEVFKFYTVKYYLNIN